MSPWKVILATLVIFCSGLATGTLMTKKLYRPAGSGRLAAVQAAKGSTNTVNIAWSQQQGEFLRRMDRELKLSPEQRLAVEKILRDSQDRTKAIRDKIAPEIRNELKQIHEQIRRELTAGQTEKFDKLVKLKPGKKAAENRSEPRRRVQPPDAAPVSQEPRP